MVPKGVSSAARPEVNGDKKRLSRKWVLAVSSLLVVTAYGSWGVFALAETAQDCALVIAAWLSADALLLKIYNDSNNDAARITYEANRLDPNP